MLDFAVVSSHRCRSLPKSINLDLTYLLDLLKFPVTSRQPLALRLSSNTAADFN
jgi:hypothetical protein